MNFCNIKDKAKVTLQTLLETLRRRNNLEIEQILRTHFFSKRSNKRKSQVMKIPVEQIERSKQFIIISAKVKKLMNLMIHSDDLFHVGHVIQLIEESFRAQKLSPEKTSLGKNLRKTEDIVNPHTETETIEMNTKVNTDITNDPSHSDETLPETDYVLEFLCKNKLMTPFIWSKSIEVMLKVRINALKKDFYSSFKKYRTMLKNSLLSNSKKEGKTF